ncbi:MAG: hypothetical protein R3C97_00365 [Geminicoccaceae bacterium]
MEFLAPGRRTRRRSGVSGLALLAALGLAACGSEIDLGKTAPHDELAGLTREDFAAALERRETASGLRAERSARRPASRARRLAEEKVQADPGPSVTLSVNETVPLKDVLISLARQADREIEIDPRIEGGIILSVRNRPFLKVIERIAKLGGLRFSIEDGILRVELDEPYHKAYALSFLDVEREFSSSVNTSVNVYSGGGSGGSGGNGSTNSISTSSTNHLWKDIESTLEQLLASHAPPRLVDRPLGSGTLVQLPEQGSEAVNLGTESGDLTAALAAADALASTARSGLSGSSSDDAANAAASTQEGGNDETNHYFTLNRTAGLLNVHATERQHAAIADYLDRLERSLTSQVLIEAKILEVNLAEEFHTGINWRAVLGDTSAAAPLGGSLTPQPGPFDSLVTALPNAFSIALDTGDLEGVLSLVETFGTARTLSSPRVTVLQGHTAVLKVTENQVFFRLDYEREEDDNGTDRITVSSEINTVPVGVVVTVQPAIDLETETVSMTLRPTITRVTGTVDDPAVSIASNNSVRSTVPVVAVQEIDSVVKMDSGDTIVMGGLMQDDVSRDDQGVPMLSTIPLFGHLFKARDEMTDRSELVIFLRATIIEADDPVGDKDLDLYREFARDPRPFAEPSAGPAQPPVRP